MEQKIYIRTTSDRQLGPLSFSELKRAIHAGRISLQDSIWHQYHKQWVKMSDVPRFRHIFNLRVMNLKKEPE